MTAHERHAVPQPKGNSQMIGTDALTKSFKVQALCAASIACYGQAKPLRRRMSEWGLHLTAPAVSAFARRKRPSPAYAIRSCLSQSLFIGYCAYDAMNHIVDPLLV
jgi:hypothetical protein